ncbi:MAG: L-histidine N(alpha)-methyltransferase [Acidimicrobiales bacterium]
MSSTLTVDIHLDDHDLRASLETDARRGLTATPKFLLPKYFYDDRGSELFDEITRVPEYYPTRREAEILRREAATIAKLSEADTLVELGSGTSEKTRLLLDAMRDAGTLKRFMPFDVSEGMLRSAAAAIDEEYPGTEVHAVVGDFERHLGLLPRRGRRLVAFLGGTIGNLNAAARASFLVDLASGLDAGDTLLLGTDLVKDPDRLVRAYDDASGVTAAFNKNILLVLNRELGANFDPGQFDHVAVWDAAESRIEMRLRSVADQTVEVKSLDLHLTFTRDEEMRTEISSKFVRATVEAELDAGGFELTHWFTDEDDDYALSLSVRR